MKKQPTCEKKKRQKSSSEALALLM